MGKENGLVRNSVAQYGEFLQIDVHKALIGTSE